MPGKSITITQLMNQIRDENADIDIIVVHVFFIPSQAVIMTKQTGIDNKEYKEVFFNPALILMKTSEGNKKYECQQSIHFTVTKTKRLNTEYKVNMLEIEGMTKTFNNIEYYPARIQYYTHWKKIYDKVFEQHKDDEPFHFESRKKSEQEEDYDDSILE